MEAPFPHAGELAALGTAVCWTATSLAFEAAGRRIGSLPVNLIRLVMAVFLLGGFTWLTRGQPLPVDASPHAWLWLGLSGLIGFTVGDLCLFRAFVVVGARISMLLMTLVPVITAVVGYLVMGEVLSPKELLGMALTIAGVSTVVWERRPNAEGALERLPPGGILLGLAGAAGQAVGLVLSKYGMGSYDAFAATHIRVIVGCLGFAVVFTLTGWWPRVGAAVRDGRAMVATGIGAVFGPFLGVSLSLLAVQYTEAGVAATLIALTPVMIIPVAVLVYRERVAWPTLVGALVAVGGSALLFL
ncbi:MAG: DMT family transporter [Gemmatimonadota bacterium]|jgi:drug/metabolite transporter (DMT)-like permease